MSEQVIKDLEKLDFRQEKAYDRLDKAAGSFAQQIASTNFQAFYGSYFAKAQKIGATGKILAISCNPKTYDQNLAVPDRRDLRLATEYGMLVGFGLACQIVSSRQCKRFGSAAISVLEDINVGVNNDTLDLSTVLKQGSGWAEYLSNHYSPLMNHSRSNDQSSIGRGCVQLYRDGMGFMAMLGVNYFWNGEMPTLDFMTQSPDHLATTTTVVEN